jgi:CRP/FNR family cyclic AMP-dependent transcriptional regulator
MTNFDNVCSEDKCKGLCGSARKDSFCCLPGPASSKFDSIKIPRGFSKGSILFMEGQPSKGVYILCSGRVKLSACSQEGKVIILGIAEKGDIIGLGAVMNGIDHETSAEALETCTTNFVRSNDFLEFLKTDPAACLNAAKQMSRNYLTAYQQICSLGLSDSVADKLAKLFLGWSGNGHGPVGRVHLKNRFTHEEMAEMIGTSRETVTRALRYLRELDLITVKGTDLFIHDRQRLRAAIGTRPGARPMVRYAHQGEG